MKTRARKTQRGFTLIEVVVALAIIALTAMVLLDRRVQVVHEAGRSRDVKTAWMLASRKLGELELDKTFWKGTGGQSAGDFGELDPVFADFRWEFQAERVPVDALDPALFKPGQKPPELFHVGLKVDGPNLGEPIVVEAMLPVDEPPPAAAAPAAGGASGSPAPPGGGGAPGQAAPPAGGGGAPK